MLTKSTIKTWLDNSNNKYVLVVRDKLDYTEYPMMFDDDTSVLSKIKENINDKTIDILGLYKTGEDIELQLNDNGETLYKQFTKNFIVGD